ncbi:PREDICTED: uncharacterized protein LOC108525256 [Rhinopithecus bieti]|uniref:uncharacterized protein LOC108525256 n=1 Tax=Rhinopithecus bieti TaxID=61621 RepID=UPI00083C3C04|nr:PREDICTED: uncharacterized protein LOC108525256 [Rhinopithecus bieti]
MAFPASKANRSTGHCFLPHSPLSPSAAPVVTGTGPNFSLGELQGHLAYDLNPASTGLRRTLPSTSSSGSKRHKSGSMEEDVDTSPGGDYYTSPSSPTSSSRNWTEDMEGGRAGGGGGAGLPVGVTAVGTTSSGSHCAGAAGQEASLEPRSLLGMVVASSCAWLEVRSGLAFSDLFGSAEAGEGRDCPLSDFPALHP